MLPARVCIVGRRQSTYCLTSAPSAVVSRYSDAQWGLLACSSGPDCAAICAHGGHGGGRWRAAFSGNGGRPLSGPESWLYGIGRRCVVFAKEAA